MPETPEATAATASGPNRYFLAKAPIWRSLAHLCIPMIAGLLVGVVYNIVNAGFVGALNSTPMLAALTFSLPVFSIIMAVGNVFGVGGGTAISRLLGSEDHAETSGTGTDAARADGTTGAGAGTRVRQTGSFTLWGAVLGGVAIAVLGLVFLTPLAAAVGASGDSLAPAAQYIGAMFAFAPVLVAAFALEQIVRAEGAATISMIGLIISTIANLVLDVLFILVLHWGVLGAGIALGLSNVVTVAYYAWWITKRASAVSIAPRWFHVDREMLATVFGVGVSEFLQASFLIVSSLVMNWVSVAYGAALLAAMGVAQRIAQLPEMTCMGIFMGAVPLFAYAFGARDDRRLRSATRTAAIAIAGVTVVFSGVVFLFRDQVFGLFSADPSVLDDGTRILTAMLVATLFNGFTGLFVAVFQATGQMRNATVMSIAQGILYVPVVLVGNAAFGITGVVWAMTVAEVITFALGPVLYLTSRGAPAGSKTAPPAGATAFSLPVDATAAPSAANGSLRQLP